MQASRNTHINTDSRKDCSYIEHRSYYTSSVRDDVNYYANADFYCPHPDWDHVEMNDDAFVPHEEDFF